MKTPRDNTPRPAAPAQRTFTWAVRTSDIAFMEDGPQALLDGCSGNLCSDCGCAVSQLQEPDAGAPGEQQ